MPDILIRHCTLYLVRRGGWSWGENPTVLARKAAGALGGLLERRFGEMWPESGDVEIVAPVRLKLAMRMEELAEASENGFEGDRAHALLERFREVVDQAIREAVNAIPSARATEPQVSPEPKPRPDEITASPFEKLLTLLLSWLRAGALEQILRDAGERTVEDWHATLLSYKGERPRGAGSSQIELRGASRASRNEPIPESTHIPFAMDAVARAARTHALATRIDVLRTRIISIIAAVEASGVGAVCPALVAALDRDYPLPQATTDDDSRRSDPPTSTPAIGETASLPTVVGLPSRHSDAPRAVPAPSRAMSWRQPAKPRADAGLAHCALPFLMLGSLSKMGYFEGLDALLAAAQLSEEAPLFATALAFKVLDPPERGWRRSAADTNSAAVFAGLDQSASNEALAAFALKAADFLPVLDRVVADALASGHADGSPLLLCEVAGGGWMLADVDGVFPVATSTRCEALLSIVERFGRPRLLVPASSAGGGLLMRLDAEGYRFITDTPPTRAERWRRFKRLPHERWCTNDVESPEGPLVASARKLASAYPSIQTTWEELALRPCLAPGDGGSLETSMMLVAAVALADLSWNLWNDTGDTDPLLAIERFGDLEARVRFSPGEVVVKLPLGKRSMDLSRHGLLDDVPGVPWFGGRVVRFSGG
jgi:hypothetical protein